MLSYGLHFMGIDVPVWWYRNCYFDGFPFFLIGYYIHQNQENIEKKMKKNNIFNVLTIVLVGGVLSSVERLLIGGYDIYFGTILMVIPVFIYSVFNSNKSFFVPIEKIGQKMTLYIYLIHPYVIYTINDIENHMGLGNKIVFTWIKPVMVLLLSVAISLGAYACFNIKRLGQKRTLQAHKI